MGTILSWFKKDGETQQAAPPVSKNDDEQSKTPAILRFAVLVGLLALMIVSILLHSIDSFNNQNVATHIGGMFLGLGLLLTMWISLRSSANAKKRRVGDGVYEDGASTFRNYAINLRGFIISLFIFGLVMATWYMGTRHKRPLSERYTILVPSVVLCLVIWLRFWNGRDGQNGENAREIPLIIFMLNLFGIVYAFTAFIDNHTTTNVLWFILLGCLLLVLFVQTMWDWRNSKQSVADKAKTKAEEAKAKKEAEEAATFAENVKACVDEILKVGKPTDSESNLAEYIQQQTKDIGECLHDVVKYNEIPSTLKELSAPLRSLFADLLAKETNDENEIALRQQLKILADHYDPPPQSSS